MEPELVVVVEPDLIEMGSPEYWQIVSGASIRPTWPTFPTPQRPVGFALSTLPAERRRIMAELCFHVSVLRTQVSHLRRLGRTDHLPKR